MFSKLSFIAVVPLLLATIALPVYAQELTGTIISIGDGDTFRASVNNTTQTIRLACIDTPETGQRPWGQQSTNRLKQLLPVGQVIRVRQIEKDKYGRTVAEVFKDNQSVNFQMVAEGNAVVYRQYLKGCANTQNQFLQAEANAKKQRLAFWNQTNPVMPWDFRRTAQKPSQATQQQQCEPSYPDVCIPKNSPTLKCSDISQRKFRVLSPDPYRFDRDGDGIGCER